MKHLLLLALFMSLSLSAFSQTTFRIQGGIELAGMTANDNYGVGDQLGYRFGAGVDIPFNRRWSLLTGMYLIKKVHDTEESRLWRDYMYEGEQYYYRMHLKSRIAATYLHLPIKVQWDIPLRQNLSLMVNGGVYFAYGIDGMMRDEVSQMGISNPDMPHNGDLQSDSRGELLVSSARGEQETFNRRGLYKFDAGLSAGADLRYRFIYLGFSAEYGVTPLTREKIPKDFPNYLIGRDKRLVSPHNLSVEVHAGLILTLFSK
jgi:hypothetical protein